MPGKEFEMLHPLSLKNPFLNFMGIELLDAGEGWVRMRLKYRPNFLQPFTVHGGAIYSLADAAAAHALLTLIMPDQRPTTVEQRINFLKATKDHDVFGEARIVHLGKTLAYAEVTMSAADGVLIAKSTATLMRLDASRMIRKDEGVDEKDEG
jgi:uncharacterized protein (TIGR00369 family)